VAVVPVVLSEDGDISTSSPVNIGDSSNSSPVNMHCWNSVADCVASYTKQAHCLAQALDAVLCASAYTGRHKH
jgi:hypothetical protein